MSLLSSSQNTKEIKIGRDSTTVSNRALISMQKESRKCDSLKSAVVKKNALIDHLTAENIKAYNGFFKEQQKIDSLEIEKKNLERQIKRFGKKRFSFGITVGPVLTDSFEIDVGIMAGINFKLFEF